MDEAAGGLRRRYIEGLWAFVGSGSEALREKAFALGREALESGLGILDLAVLQREAAAGLEPGPAQDRAAEFFTEALAPYEMRLRGAQEANERLNRDNQALEQRVEERTRGLREKDALLLQAHKMEAVGRLAGGIAHDFNNLLTVIGGYIDLCLEKAAGGGLEGDLQLARKSVDQASQLTRQLLSFSRKQVSSPRSVDLNASVGESLTMLRRLVGARIQIVFEPSPQPCSAWVDPGQLSQVLMNLVINARDAMPSGGRIDVSIAAVELSPGHLAGHSEAGAPGAYALLSVRDHGMGMDAPTQARIFEPFFSTKGPGRGTGLGLATTYAIVEQSRGLIVVDSAPGEGATFKVYLPAAAPSDAGPPAAAPAQGQGRETLLLVEDDENVRALSRSVLSASGYRVLEADCPSRAEAIARAHADEIPLLVTDIEMPEMTGYSLYQRLREDRTGLRALFLSGLPSRENVERGPLAPGTAFLEKPFIPTELVRQVRALLDQAAVPEQP